MVDIPTLEFVVATARFIARTDCAHTTRSFFKNKEGKTPNLGTLSPYFEPDYLHPQIPCYALAAYRDSMLEVTFFPVQKNGVGMEHRRFAARCALDSLLLQREISNQQNLADSVADADTRLLELGNKLNTFSSENSDLIFCEQIAADAYLASHAPGINDVRFTLGEKLLVTDLGYSHFNANQSLCLFASLPREYIPRIARVLDLPSPSKSTDWFLYEAREKHIPFYLQLEPHLSDQLKKRDFRYTPASYQCYGGNSPESLTIYQRVQPWHPPQHLTSR